MKNFLAFALVLTLSLGVLAGCGGGGDKGAAKDSNKSINIFTWDGVFPAEVLEDFTKETGIKVNYNYFDTDEIMLAKLKAAKGGDYDFVIADDYIIQDAIKEGLVAKMDQSKLTELKEIDPQYKGLFYDKDNAYTIPFAAGVQTIVYNPEKVKSPITCYEDLWSPELKDQIGIVGNFRVINGMALKTLGKSYNTENVNDIKAAGDKLKKLAPNVHLIKNGNMQNDLLSGEVNAAIMYTSEVTAALKENPNLKVVFPKEGIGFGVMAGFIPENAPDKDSVYKFINYIMQPEVAKKCMEYIGYYSTNLGADKLFSPEMKKALTLPENLNKNEMEMIQPVGPEASDEHSKVWTEFEGLAGKSAQ